MKHLFGAAATATLAAAASLAMPAQPAQAYQVDCAILLCLSGGWPASTPCSMAKAEFIRRITPSPIEPPLQIWRCPMHATYPGSLERTPEQRLHDIALGEGVHSVQSPYDFVAFGTSYRKHELPQHAAISAVLRRDTADSALSQELVQQVGNYSSENGVADIDISDPVFDFVRSIRVYSVEHMHQRARGKDNDDCQRSNRIRIGRYGQQGEFYWRDTDPSALPAAFVGNEGWGATCPYISRRAVFVDWSDYQGNYGYEQVNY